MTPTLVMMLKAPRPGFVKTRLAAGVGAAAAARIYRQLVERQLDAVPPDWPVTICFTPDDALTEMKAWLTPRRLGLVFVAQSNGDLGRRLVAAFAAAFASGAQTVLVAGGDCPSLDRFVLQAAGRALPTAQVVLGPACDGGYYLLGLSAPAPELFTDIAWSTPQVLAQTRALIARSHRSLVELPTLADLDTPADWERALAAGHAPAPEQAETSDRYPPQPGY